MSEKIECTALLDETGRQICVGDVLKIYHFTARLRREKRYMYKYVSERITAGNGEFFKIMHLNENGDYYFEAINGRKLNGTEIVQGYGGVFRGQCYKDRVVHRFTGHQ